MKPITVLAALSAFYSTPAFSQTERDLDSHVHGLATLNVAVTGSEVFIELSSPWNNMVGFEHEPETDEQHALVDEAIHQLNEADELFLFNSGDCAVTDVSLENSMSEESHDDEHDDEHKDEHKDEHADEHSEEGSAHSAVLVTYSYKCGDMDKLSSIDIALFSIWSGFEDLDVQLIGESGQTAIELDPQNTVLNLQSIK